MDLSFRREVRGERGKGECEGKWERVEVYSKENFLKVSRGKSWKMVFLHTLSHWIPKIIHIPLLTEKESNAMRGQRIFSGSPKSYFNPRLLLPSLAPFFFLGFLCYFFFLPKIIIWHPGRTLNPGLGLHGTYTLVGDLESKINKKINNQNSLRYLLRLWSR